MNSTDPQPQEDKATRQLLMKSALFFAVGVLLLITTVVLMMLLMRLLENVFGASAILLRVLMLVINIGGLVLTVALIIASIVYFRRWLMSDLTHRNEHSGEILQRTPPDLVIKQESEADEEPSFWQSFVQLIPLSLFLSLFFVLVGALTLAIGEGLKLIWTDVPGWIQKVGGLIVLIGSVLIIGRVVDRRRKRRGEPTTSLKEGIERWVRGLFFYLLNVLPVLWVTEKVSDLNLNPIFKIPASFILAAMTFGLLNLAYTVIPDFWITAAIERGNYDQALWRVQIAKKFSPSLSAYLQQHGHILWRAGRYTEAEQILHPGSGGMASGSSGASTLGDALMEQGEYEEAVKVLEDAIALGTNEGSLYDSLADAYLSQGIDTDKALDLLDQALTRHQSSWFKRWSRQRSISAAWAGRAWALARLGKRAEAAEALEKAFALAPRKRNADFAEILYRAGHALALLGETQKAAEHFAEAQRLDPHGHYGRLCAEAASRLQGTEFSIG